jgi:hypothetical protein
MKPEKRIHILIVNNAEKGISEFTQPLEKIVSAMGFHISKPLVYVYFSYIAQNQILIACFFTLFTIFE